MNESGRSIVVSVPSRGRPKHLRQVVEKLAATKSLRTTVVVVLNGPETLPDRARLEGIHFVHIGAIPTIPVAVNFGWYAMRKPSSILVKLDNDVLPPVGWEDEVMEKSRAIGLGGFLCDNEYSPTPTIVLGGHRMRRAHISHTWGMPFVYSGFIWLSPRIAQLLQYEDERFVRSDDGDLGDRLSRIAGAMIGYSADLSAVHMSPGPEGSTEPSEIVAEMYRACDLLINALPPRPIAQDTIWSQCLSPAEAEALVLAGGVLPMPIQRKAQARLRRKLEQAFDLVGQQNLVTKIFERI